MRLPVSTNVLRRVATKLRAYKESRGWTLPWYSSFGSDFNFDFEVTAPDKGDGEPDEWTALSCFLRDGEAVFHTYSTWERGVEVTMSGYHLLDLTALGRQEDWEEPRRVEHPYPADPSYTPEPL